MNIAIGIACLVMLLLVIDYYAKKSADKAMEDELATELHMAFGHLQGPISLELAKHEAEHESINGLFVEDGQES